MPSSNQGEHSLPDGFANIVRLFPLPNLVLFPGVVQALHLFEPRYRKLAADALAADELITVAFIKPGWEDKGGNHPEISPTVCVGKILSHTILDDGRYNMFLVGAKRAHIVNEIVGDTPYRMAQVKILDDRLAGSESIDQLRQEIIENFRRLANLHSDWNHEAMGAFLDGDMPFGQLIDIICYSCGSSPLDQQRVLETIELRERGRIVLDLLKAQVETQKSVGSVKQDFPPGFSLN